MPVVRVVAAAEADLREIWTYVAQHDRAAASKLVKEITHKFVILRDYPQMGREQDALLVNLRSFAVKGYIIFYQPFEDGIEVLRVLHSARDIESIFERFLDSL
jgi:toxin ParE1/3/4